MNAFGFGHAF
jgi:hypothetical protein